MMKSMSLSELLESSDSKKLSDSVDANPHSPIQHCLPSNTTST